MTNEKIYQMDFAKIYQLLVDKAVRKGGTANAGNPLFGQAGGRAGERKIDGENTPSVAHQLDPNQI